MTSVTWRRRRGILTQIMVPLLVTIIPLVALLFLRSHQRLKFVHRAQVQLRALAALRSAQELLLARMAAGEITPSVRRNNSEGGLELATTLAGQGALGQPIVRFRATGTHLDESVSVVGFAELVRIAGQNCILVRDSSYRTGARADPAEEGRVDRYVAQVRAEAGMSTTQFLNIMRDQCRRLGSPDVDASWDEIAQALVRSKIQAPPQPGPSRTALTRRYLAEGLRKAERFGRTYRAFLLTEDAVAAAPATEVTSWEGADDEPTLPAGEAPPAPAPGPAAIPEVSLAAVPGEGGGPGPAPSRPPTGPPGERVDPLGPMGTARGAINPSSGKSSGAMLDMLRGRPPPSPSP